MSNEYQIRKQDFTPAQLGLSAQVLSAERTSTTMDCSAANQLTVMVDLTTWAAATTVSVQVDIRDEGDAQWFPLQAASIAAGVATMTDLIWRKTVTAADQWEMDTPINANQFRIRITSAGGTTDTASVYARLAAL